MSREKQELVTGHSCVQTASPQSPTLIVHETSERDRQTEKARTARDDLKSARASVTRAKFICDVCSSCAAKEMKSSKTFPTNIDRLLAGLQI